MADGSLRRIRLVLADDAPGLDAAVLAFDADASVRNPSRNMTVSTAPRSAASWRISTLPSSEIVLRSQRCQRLSSAVTTATPWSTCSRVGVGSGLLIMNTVGGTPFGNAWSRRATPRVIWK